MFHIERKLESGEELAANCIGKCGVNRKTSPSVDRKIVNFCKQQENLVVSERTVSEIV